MTAEQEQRVRIVGRRWQLGEVIGSGGFGAVYRGHHVTTEQQAAIKVLHSRADAATAERFAQKVRVPVRLGNPPGIAMVYDAGADDDGSLYVAMEVLAGFTLAERMAHVDALETLELISDMLESLAIAHERGFVHRDLKPENVFVLRRPDRGVRTKLLDFGIAKWLGDAPDTRSQVIGTPHYMSPEHMSGEVPTPASDVWSVGVMLYEALAGVLPFDGQTPVAIVAAVMSASHEPLAQACPWVPSPLVQLVESCLQKAPGVRPRSARELRHALEHMLAERAIERVLAGRRASPDPSAPRVSSLVVLTTSSVSDDEPAHAVPPTLPIELVDTLRASTSAAERSVPRTILLDSAASSSTELREAAPGISRFNRPAIARLAIVALVAVVGAIIVATIAIVAWPDGDEPMSEASEGVDPARSAEDLLRLGWAAEHDDGDDERARELYEQACDGGSAAGCAHLARFYETGRGGLESDDGRARGLYEQACEGWYLAACTTLGRFYETSRGGLERNDARARELYDRACEGRSADGCARLGSLHERGRAGLARDGERARELYQRACDERSLLGCDLLGSLYERGRGGLARDDARARDLYQGACDQGHGAACADLGWLYERGRGVERDDARARVLYERACDAPNDPDCGPLGYVHKRQGDLARAMELSEGACGRPRGIACADLGAFYLYGLNGVRQSDDRARELFERACDLDEWCGWLGYMYDVGRGVARDERRALELYQRDCDFRDESCHTLGSIYARGHGVARDDVRARQLFERACDGRDATCDQLAAFYDQGRGGLVRDAARARALYERACNGDGYEGCLAAAARLERGVGGPRDRARARECYRRACLLLPPSDPRRGRACARAS